MITRLLHTSAALEPLDDLTLNRLVEHTAGRTGAQISELLQELESRLIWDLQKNKQADIATTLGALIRDSIQDRTLGFATGSPSRASAAPTL